MDVVSPGIVPLVPQSTYVRELRPDLPSEAFAPARSRLALVPAHLAAVAAGILAIATGRVPWPVVPLISLARRYGFLKPRAFGLAILESLASSPALRSGPSSRRSSGSCRSCSRT